MNRTIIVAILILLGSVLAGYFLKWSMEGFFQQTLDASGNLHTSGTIITDESGIWQDASGNPVQPPMRYPHPKDIRTELKAPSPILVPPETLVTIPAYLAYPMQSALPGYNPNATTIRSQPSPIPQGHHSQKRKGAHSNVAPIFVSPLRGMTDASGSPIRMDASGNAFKVDASGNALLDASGNAIPAPGSGAGASAGAGAATGSVGGTPPSSGSLGASATPVTNTANKTTIPVTIPNSILKLLSL
jgi:hypothetical protein